MDMASRRGELLELLVCLRDGSAGSDALIEWATAELGEGADSPSLRVLAGLLPSEPTSETQRYFVRALSELGIAPPKDEATLRRQYLRVIAARIVSGSVTPHAGAQMIHDHVVAPLEHAKDVAHWCYLLDNLEPDGRRPISEQEAASLIRDEARAVVSSEP